MRILKVVWYLLQSLARWVKWKLRLAPYPPGPHGPWAAFNTVRAFVSPTYAAKYYPYMVKKYGTVVLTPAPFWQFVVILADAEGHHRVTMDWRRFPRGWIQSQFASFIGHLIGTEQHREIRSMANEYLDRKAVENYVPTVQDEILKLFERWQKQGQTGISVTEDLVGMFAELSAKFLVGGHPLKPGLGSKIVELITLFQSNPFGSKFDTASKHVFAEIEELLKLSRRKKMGIISAFAHEIDMGRMTQKQVIPEIIGLISASVETTANLVAALIYELTRNKLFLTKIRNEAQYVFQGKSVATAEDVFRLSQAFLATDEAARLWPAAWRQQRAVAMSNLTLWGKRNGEVSEIYRLPKWAQVFSIVQIIQTDPSIWGEDAFEFKPEKHVTEEALKSRPKGAFMPWAAGIHMCPGMTLSRYEAALFAALFALSFKDPFFRKEHEPVFSATLGFPRDAKLFL